MDNQDGRLWTPGGLSSTQERQVAKAIKEYDQDLILGQRADGEWVVFLRPQGIQDPFPVLGLGYSLPSADHVKAKLFKHDVQKNGRAVYRKMLASMEQAQKETIYRANEGVGVAAEAMESAFRRQGSHPRPRIFVPGRP